MKTVYRSAFEHGKNLSHYLINILLTLPRNIADLNNLREGIENAFSDNRNPMTQQLRLIVALTNIQNFKVGRYEILSNQKSVFIRDRNRGDSGSEIYLEAKPNETAVEKVMDQFRD